MQETRNNCFRSKKCSTTLRQAKTGKQECRNVTATYMSSLVLTCFCLMKGCAAFFRLDCCEFLASYDVILQSDIQLYFKTPVCGAPFSYLKAFDGIW